ncbi:MAG: NADH:flavin oxidoreductase/NADH oxidase family protein [Spirochaetota bacterium]
MANIDIFSELKIHTSLPALQNRLVKSAMSEQLAEPDGNPSSGLATLYSCWSEGGTSLLITGNVMIDRTALGEPKNVVLDSRSDLDTFANWAHAGQKNGNQIWMQLNHPGKQSPAFLSQKPVAPSAVPLAGPLAAAFNAPRTLEAGEIKQIIQAFANAAAYAKECGFHGVQIHGAHGYLVSQFFSRKQNLRTDDWGGSAENRRRFAIEIYRSIREKVGADFGIGIKLNSADFQKGGFTEEESLQVAEALADEGIDLLEISGGNYEKPAMMGDKVKKSTIAREAYFIDFAQKLRKHVKTNLLLTGGFRSYRGMQYALDQNACDLIGLARPLALLPDLPKKLRNNLQFELTLPEISTGLEFLDTASMLPITWYEHQLELMAQGKETDVGLNPWWSMVKTFFNLGANAFTPRRPS